MAATGNHIINKVIYHVHGVPTGKAFSIKEETAAYIKGGFSNKIQTVFDKYFNGEENIYIDNLQLSLTLLPGEIDLNKYEKQLLDLLEKQLQKKAGAFPGKKIIKKDVYDEQKIKDTIENAIEKDYSPADAFIYFLKRGYLPWWCKINSVVEFEQQVIAFIAMMSNHKIRETARGILKGGPQAVYRFIHQFTNNFKFKMAAVFLQQPVTSIKALHLKLIAAARKTFYPPIELTPKPGSKNAQIFTDRPFETGTDFLFWNICLHTMEAGNSFQKLEATLVKFKKKMLAFASKPDDRNTLLQKLIEESENELVQPEKSDAAPEQKEKNDASGQIFVNNAGLVLLHPFLSTLFNALHIVQEDKVIDTAKAIACLNYLCGYEKMQPEFEWPLMKILCGMDVSETIEHLAELTDTDRLECNALLQQVIDYWIALKQTSLQGLQQTFIQRFGKLSAKENGWLLQVEQKTVDVLKDRLPWGVSMVKLPWMQQLLMVEW